MTAHGATGIAAAAREVGERVRALVRLEAELAALELRRKGAALGAGLALLLAAALLLLLALGLGLATVAVALALVVPTWLALLLVTAGTVVAALLAALGGRRLVRRAGPPVPERALAEAKATGEALRGDGRG